MNRLYLILCFILLCFSWGQALEVVTNSYNNTTSIYILIPFEQLIFSADKGTAHYQLSVNLIDTKRKSLVQDVFDIKAGSPFYQKEVMKQASFVQEISIPQKAGNYRLTTQLRNVDLGDKTEKQTDITLDDTKSYVKDIIIADNGQFKYVPSAFNQINPQLKSCYMVLDTSASYDSIMIKYEINSVVNRVKASTTDSNRLDLLPILREGKLTSLEPWYYTGNIINTPLKSFIRSNNKDQGAELAHTGFTQERSLAQLQYYLQTFTLQEQLQQIRYIATQNEWKLLRKVADKDLAEAIERYWERHKSNPGTSLNETRELFYERVLRADELFTIHKKLRGWKSDRGRIYIRYGQPDEVVEDTYYLGDYPDVRTYPHIKWYYYRANKAYNFLDKTGYGDFQIMDEYYEN